MKPTDIPLDKWPDGWLKLECGSLLDQPMFLIMTDQEKLAMSYPVSRDAMIYFIRQEWGKEGFTR